MARNEEIDAKIKANVAEINRLASETAALCEQDIATEDGGAKKPSFGERIQLAVDKE